MLQSHRSLLHWLPKACASGLVPADATRPTDDAVRLAQRLEEESRLRRQLEGELHALKAELSVARTQLLESRSHEQHARTLAGIDCLTGLFNRSAFNERLRDALRASGGRPWDLVVMYIDLDGFKRVNDDLGHHVGDELLKIVGARLSSCMRAEDAIGRYGGDEFVCMLRQAGTRERASQIACKVFNTLAAPYRIADVLLNVRASIGIAWCRGDGATAASLLRRADLAMYRAKRQRIGYVFDAEEAVFEPAAPLGGLARGQGATPRETAGVRQ